MSVQILIVDDDKTFVYGMKEFLKLRNVPAITARSASEVPFFPETVMQIGRFYDLHHGRNFVSVSSENDQELHELNTVLPDKEEIFKYEILSSVTPAELVDEIIPETIEYQRRLKQMWIDMGIYNAVQYDFDKEFEVHYDIDNKKYYILADGKRFADIEVKRTTFFKIIYAHI